MKDQIKEIKKMIIERETEITRQCYRECKDYEVRMRQSKDKRLINLYKIQETLETLDKNENSSIH